LRRSLAPVVIPTCIAFVVLGPHNM
jgi:hypothetical protein